MPKHMSRTLLRLALACLLVGLVLNVLGVSPQELLGRLGGTVFGIFETVVRLITWTVPYILIGAVVVVPIWLILLVWRKVRGR